MARLTIIADVQFLQVDQETDGVGDDHKFVVIRTELAQAVATEENLQQRRESEDRQRRESKDRQRLESEDRQRLE